MNFTLLLVVEIKREGKRFFYPVSVWKIKIYEFIRLNSYLERKLIVKQHNPQRDLYFSFIYIYIFIYWLIIES